MADYLIQRYLKELAYNQSINKTLQRSKSVSSFTSCEHLAIMEKPELLFYITMDILSFRANLLQFCTDLLNDCKNIEPFFQTPQEAFMYLQSLQSNWHNEWMRGFLFLQSEMESLIKKHKKDAEKALVSVVQDADSCVLEILRSPPLMSLSVKENMNQLSSKYTRSRLSLIRNYNFGSVSSNSKSSSNSSLNVISPQSCIVVTQADFHRCDEPDDVIGPIDNVSDILDAISDKSSTNSGHSFELKLSSSSSELTVNKNKRKIYCSSSSNELPSTLQLQIDRHGMKRACYVQISFSERQLCNKLIKNNRKTHGEFTQKVRSTSKRKLSFSSDSSSDLSSIKSDNIKSNENDDINHTSPSESPVEQDSEREEEKVDSQDVLDDISDELSSSSDESGANEEKTVIKKKIIRKTHRSQSNETVDLCDSTDGSPEKLNKSSALWKQDPLLKETLDDSINSKKEIKKRLSLGSKTFKQSSLGCKTLDNWLVKSPNKSKLSEITDSDFEISPLKKEQKIIASPNKKGRRNIKDIISEDDLNEETQKAKKSEQARIERLKEKQNSQSQASLAISDNEDDYILDSSDDKNNIIVHYALTSKLMPHQKQGVMFMWDNCYESVNRLKKEAGSGCILAHCMGLGKTFQVVVLVHTLLLHPVTNTKRVLILCPLSTVINWKAEFRSAIRRIGGSNTSKIVIYTIGRTTANTSDRSYIIRRWHGAGGVLILGYESFVALAKPGSKEDLSKYLLDPGPDLVVCDEGHLLKSGTTDRTKVISKIATKRRIILTGTPMQNNLEEYYYMVSFVKPTILGTYAEYRNRFINPITNGQYENSSPADIRLMKNRSHVLHKMTKGFIQRYEESELHQHLPKKYDYAIHIELHEVQIKLYETFLNMCRNNKQQLFANLTIFRLIYMHPGLLALHDNYADILARKANRNNLDLPANNLAKEKWWINLIPEDTATNIAYGPKLIVMMHIIKDCTKRKEKVLVFSNSRREFDLIENFLRHQNQRWRHESNYFRMDGTVPLITRTRYCEIFNNASSDICLMLITTGIGGLGLNLTGANRVILMDVNWNPTIGSQSIFRVYRLGQTKPCYVYRLIAKGTIEEVIYERSVTKQAIAGRVVDEKQLTRHFSLENVDAMYRSNFEKKPRPMLKVPQDNLMANMLQEYDFIYSYQDYEELLKNLPDEELNAEEMKLAWEEYEREKQYVPLPPMPVTYEQSLQQSARPSTSINPPNNSFMKNYKSAVIFNTSRGMVVAQYNPEGQIIYPKENLSDVQIDIASRLFPNVGKRPYNYLINPNGTVKCLNIDEPIFSSAIVSAQKPDCSVIELSD